MSDSKTGVVKFFNHAKGFGFIVADDGGKDLFAHINNIKSGDIKDGSKVKFTPKDDPKGLMAVDIEVID